VVEDKHGILVALHVLGPLLPQGLVERDPGLLGELPDFLKSLAVEAHCPVDIKLPGATA
jgi:hypothetical protein